MNTTVDVKIIGRKCYDTDIHHFLCTYAGQVEYEDATAFGYYYAQVPVEYLKKFNDLVEQIHALFVSSTLETKLNGSFECHRFGELQMFAPHALRHPRQKMSPETKSKATYSHLIDLPNIQCNDGTSAILIQHLHGTTSRHFHRKTHEIFIPLAGNVLMNTRTLGRQNHSEHQLDKMTAVEPFTVHSLSGIHAINLLCMMPYDESLNDHYYC